MTKREEQISIARHLIESGVSEEMKSHLEREFPELITIDSTDVECVIAEAFNKGLISSRLKDGCQEWVRAHNKEFVKAPEWMCQFLNETRSKDFGMDYDAHKVFEGQILAIIEFLNSYKHAKC